MGKITRILIAAIFALLAVNAVVETFSSDGPQMLRALQAAMLVLATVTAWGAWTRARWAHATATAYGFVTAGMLVALEPMLGLPPTARNGLWAGGALVLLFCLACAWFLRRATRRPSPELTDVI